MSDDPNPVPETGIEVFKAALRPQRRPSDRQIVRESLPEIVGKLNEGWRYEEIRVELERTLGFKGNLRTLYRYVSIERQQQRNATGTESVNSTSPVSPPSESVGGADTTSTPVGSSRRRISDLASPGYAERLRARTREREEKRKKPKSTMVDMVNKPV